MLAAIPRGQAHLRWMTQGDAAEESSDLPPPLPSPAASAARPPLATHRPPTGAASGLVLPPRRLAPPVAASTPPRRASVLKSRKRALGVSTTFNGGSAVWSPGAPPRKRGTAAAADASTTPPGRPSAHKATGSKYGASPVSVTDAARRGARATATPVAPDGARALPANSSRLPTLHPATSPSPLGLQDAPAVVSQGVHRPSLFKAPLQTRLAAVVGPPRGISFDVLQGPAADEAGSSGTKSLMPAASSSPPTALNGIRKQPKPRVKRASKKKAASKPAGHPVAGESGQKPDGPPTAASQTGLTPLAPAPPVHQIGERPVPSHVTVGAMTRVFAEGLRPVCAHLAGLAKKLDEVHTSVSRLSTSLHNQSVGNERTTQAVLQLQSAVKGVHNDVVASVKKEPGKAANLRGSTAMLDDCEAQQELATINELELGNVRDVAKKAMIGEMLGARQSYKAMPNRTRWLEILYEACESVRGGSRGDSEAYLNSSRVFLTTAGTPTEKRIRVSEKLFRVSSHVTEALQKVAMSAYFRSLGENVDEMTPVVAAKWLRKGKYAHSAKADPAINDALKAMFKRNGHHSRVVEPTDVGDDVYVDASTGHVGLITHWARGVFEKAAGVRKPRRTGNDDGAYDGWREEVRHVSGFLRWHNDAMDGLRLCDGTDKRRAMHVADDGTFVIEDSGDEVPESSAGSSGSGEASESDAFTRPDGSADPEWDSSEELLPVYAADRVDGGEAVDDGGGGCGDDGGGNYEGEGLNYGEDDEREEGPEGTEGVEREQGTAIAAGVDGGDGADNAVGVDDSVDADDDGVAAEDVASGTLGDAAGDVGFAAVVGANDGEDAPGRVDAVEGVDGGELGAATRGLLPESAAYPGGFAEYLKEVPLSQD